MMKKIFWNFGATAWTNFNLVKVYGKTNIRKVVAPFGFSRVLEQRHATDINYADPSLERQVILTKT